jgi:acetylornithine deacetylase
LSAGYSAGRLESSKETLIARALAACVYQVLRREARFGTRTLWTDAALLAGAGIPSVVFGPGGEGLHSAAEYVRLDEVVHAVEAAEGMCRSFCGA